MNFSSISPFGIWVTAVGLLASCQARQPAQQSSSDTTSKPAPQRIVSGLILTDEVLWALGPAVQARTVAVSKLVDEPQYSGVVGKWSTALPHIGQNPEQTLALAADLAFISSFTDAQVKQVLQASLPTVELKDFDGHTSYLHHLDQIGDAIGEREGTDKLKQAFLDKRKQLVQRRDQLAASWQQRLTRKPTCLSWNYDHTPGLATTFDDAASTAGCDNAAAKAGIRGHQRVDTETVLALNPDFLVIGCPSPDSCNHAQEQLAQRPGLDQLTAVKTNRLILIRPPLLSTTGHKQLELAQEMLEQIDRMLRVSATTPPTK